MNTDRYAHLDGKRLKDNKMSRNHITSGVAQGLKIGLGMYSPTLFIADSAIHPCHRRLRPGRSDVRHNSALTTPDAISMKNREKDKKCQKGAEGRGEGVELEICYSFLSSLILFCRFPKTIHP